MYSWTILLEELIFVGIYVKLSFVNNFYEIP